MSKLRTLSGAVLTALALNVAASWTMAEETTQPARPVPTVGNARGIIRIIGPDGKVHEQRIGAVPAPELDALIKKLEELRAAAGDREAVERISQELLEQVRAHQPRPLTAVGAGPDRSLPKYGIGVSLAPEVPAAVRKQLKLGEDEGVLVQSVAKDGPAAKAGLAEYDVLLAVDGNVIKSHQDMIDAVQKAGDAKAAVKIDYISGGEHKSVEVTPAASSEIEWSFTMAPTAGSLSPFHPGAGIPGLDGLILRPGVMALPDEVTGVPGQPRHFELRVPGPIQSRLEERIEALERKLDDIAQRLPKAEAN